MNMTHPSKIVVWFRRDLRLSDNPALAQAIAEKAEIVPLFIFDPYLLHHPETGSGRVQFLLGCLDSLQKNLEHLGSTLIRRYGNQPQVLLEVAAEVGADAVYWNEDTEREWRTRTDCCSIEALKEAGIKVRCFQSEAVSPAGGKESYALKFFTPQWYQFLQEPIAIRPTHLPFVQLSASTRALKTLEDLGLPMTAQTVPVAGEREAHRLLNEFLDRKVSRYLKSLSVATQASQYTSRLGAHIKFGTISVRTIYRQVLLKRQTATAWEQRNLDGFISRLFWRDHFAQKLRNLPRCETESYLEAFDAVPWSQNDQHYQAWCEGKTGYPLVDAAMRCLNATGWLPFRLRALCATFLCIDLFLPWQWGAKHYMQQLIDGDVAIDHWQWQSHAGVSNRGRSWFRVYNPVKSIEKIDPEGMFIRQWVPELANTSVEALSLSGSASLDYYRPIVDHQKARRQALEVLEPIKLKYQQL
jgi:deoxyribodipyrimidine photo-lyase